MHHGKINVSSSPGKGVVLLSVFPEEILAMYRPRFPPRLRNKSIRWTFLPCPLIPPSFLKYYCRGQQRFPPLFTGRTPSPLCRIRSFGRRRGEAVALQQKPDIIITDLMMPKMDGIELCKRIKHNIDVSHIPIILLTASASVENEERGYKEGADAYMTKPFKWEILTARIHNLLAQRRQQQNEFKQNAEAEAKDVTISPADEDFLNKALRFVEKNMDNSEYSVDELSDDMAMSRATLFRKMRSVIGMSPTDFIRNTRLKRAAQLITEGRLSVTEIAYSVGYSSPGHFTKSFKKEFGVLPTQYHKT